MKFKSNSIVLKKLINGNTEVTLEVNDKNNALISQINAHKELFNTELDVSVDKSRKRRSIEHNRLFWDMCNYLAEHINDPLITANEIYRNLIAEYGVSTIYPVPDEILEMTIRVWEERGEGWLTQTLRKSKLEGNYTNVKFYFGSSVYNSKQFWKLVEGLKSKCKEFDLDVSMYDKQMQASLAEMEKREKAKKEKDDNGNNQR